MKSPQQSMLDIAKLSQSGDDELVSARSDVKSFGANPNTKIMLQTFESLSSSDLAQQFLDSGEGVGDLELTKAVTKMSRSQKLNSDELRIVRKASERSFKLSAALSVIDKGETTSRVTADISTAVLEWSITKSMKLQGGVLSMTCQVDVDDFLRSVEPGDKFYVYIEEECVFWGTCMEITYPNEYDIQFTVNDPMWYLKNNIQWIQKKGMELEDAFALICDTLALPYEKPNIRTSKLKARVEMNSTAMGLLQTLITEVMIADDAQYFVRMSPAKLELVDLESEKSHWIDVIEAMTSFSATTSIQNETYNDIRMYSKVKKSQKGTRGKSTTSYTPYNVQDLPSIRKYGILRYQDILSNAIIKEQDLDRCLAVTKYPTNDLRLDIVGILNLFPGDTFRLLQSIYVASDISYKYDSSGYSMSITCARVQKPTSDDWDFQAEYGHAMSERAESKHKSTVEIKE